MSGPLYKLLHPPRSGCHASLRTHTSAQQPSSAAVHGAGMRAAVHGTEVCAAVQSMAVRSTEV